MTPWLDELHALWPQASARFAHLHDAGQLARAVYRDAVMTRWHCGRMVLAGDAAHAMCPQLGQGVNMALLDALALRDAVRAHGGGGAALQAYQAQRRAHVAVYQRWSRWLTPLFQSDRDAWAKARDVLLGPMGRLPGGRGHMLRCAQRYAAWLVRFACAGSGIVDALAAGVQMPGIGAITANA